MFLDPTRGHPRQHHPQRHEAGADRVVRGLIFPPRDVHHIQHVGGESETVTELLNRHRRTDPQGIGWLRHGE